MKKYKFVWNGIRDTETGKLTKCWYSKGNHIDGDEIISIYCDSYEEMPIIEGITVINESDIMTDYFEKDRAEIYPDNINYEEINNAWKELQIHELKMSIKRNEKEANRCKEKAELYKGIEQTYNYYIKWMNNHLDHKKNAENKLKVFLGV